MIKLNNDCTGCGACLSKCPTRSITMVEDSEGFLYPSVNMDACINCSVCKEICPIENPLIPNDDVECYIAVNKDIGELLSSTSGGVFSGMSKYIQGKQGYIVGCFFDDSCTALHKIVAPTEDYGIFKGSKYVQSNLIQLNIFAEVKKLLDSDKYVLFTGTPCQVDALCSYLGKKYDKLYSVDLICHGVSSPKLWSEYIKYLAKEKGKIKSYNFRSKEKYGWGLYYSCYYYDKHTGKLKGESSSEIFNPYFHSFLAGINYRESCYRCKYSSTNRVGDFTIGDFWGLESEEKYKNGASILIANTPKAKRCIDPLAEYLDLESTPIEAVVNTNHNLKAPTKRPCERDSFYRIIEDIGIGGWIKRYKQQKFYKKALVSRLIPYRLKKLIKKVIGGIHG